jgi:hypothetical protein
MPKFTWKSIPRRTTIPWTEKQFRFLMSSGSPLTEAQKDKDKAEAHDNPMLVHKKKSTATDKEKPKPKKTQRIRHTTRAR